MRIRGSVALRVTRAPDPREDLPPLRVVPVAEAQPRHERIGHPGAAPEDAVLVAVEDLGVLRIREGTEPGIPGEGRRCPLPDRAGRVLELAAAGGLLPLRLGREPLPRPLCVRLRLPVRDVLHRLPPGHRLDDVEAPSQEFPAAAELPVLGRLGALRLPPPPALVAPERSIPIAAGC